MVRNTLNYIESITIYANFNGSHLHHIVTAARAAAVGSKRLYDH